MTPTDLAISLVPQLNLHEFWCPDPSHGLSQVLDQTGFATANRSLQ